MKLRKGRLITLLVMLTLAISASLLLGYASWQFNASTTPVETVNVGITNWAFTETPIEPGQTISVDDDGNVYIDGVLVEDAEVTYPNGAQPNTNGGTISYEIGVVDGELVVTDYSATDIASDWSSFLGSNSVVSFPSAIVINGQSYPIMGVSEPVTLEIDKPFSLGLVTTSLTIEIPEGYKFICDDAFQNLTSVSRNSSVTFSLPSTLEYLGHHAFKMNITNCSISITYAGTKQQFKDLINASSAEYGSGYTFFNGANGNITISCSDGNVVYNRSGTYVSG